MVINTMDLEQEHEPRFAALPPNKSRQIGKVATIHIFKSIVASSKHVQAYSQLILHLLHYIGYILTYWIDYRSWKSVHWFHSYFAYLLTKKAER